MSIVETISCSHCGAPIFFKPGEIIATCRYCGYTVVIQTGKAFTFEHSMLLNEYDQTQIEEAIRHWMRSGFLKPPDLARKSKLTEKFLMYVPFWVVTAKVETTYKGVFERIAPPIVKEGRIAKEYDWLVLARKATEFPTREYDVPLDGKVPYDFRRIEDFAKTLNSEIDKNEAVERAKQEIEEHHRHLAMQDVDKVIEMKSEINVNQTVYLHAPIWFIKYDYEGKTYQLYVDGATGTVIKGDIPPAKFGIL
ncbi:MAG: PepSY domain-containing protein [Candidatus Bathyarchaeota archaeon]|jgi:DNA-directed RNA polymerase subunit RPC12/RpoP|nr:zinc ribbon domain-containing protein [Candidatus Bathyarchaeota archaeon A05DMB-5]MDH7557192.1 PepSY domain-containing protein [Candidatus Bathyarchaeota archaeon]